MIELYKGDVHIDFRENSHRYYLVKDGEELPRPRLVKGVTTVLNVLSKPMLIGWAAGMAADALCEAVKAVATSSDTCSPEQLKAMAEDAKNAHNRKRDASADTGKEAHKAIENFVKDGVQPSNLSKEAQNAFNAFMKWYNANDIEIIRSEGIVYSREHDYCGTYDLLAKVNGVKTLIDFKTTNASRSAPKGVYAEHFLQLGAYAQAHTEEHGEGIEEVAILSVRKDGKQDFVTNKDVELDITSLTAVFVSVLYMSRALQGLEKRLAV